MTNPTAFTSYTKSFCDLFQTAVQSDSYIEVDLDTLLTASSEASLAQYALNTKKVDALVKSLVKGAPLYIAPQLASLNGKDYTVSGRHRTSAADIICRLYGINAKGKVELKTEANDLQPIARRIRVDMVVVDSFEHLAALIMANNESRTMTAPEKASVKSFGGYASAGDKFKLRFSPILAEALSLTDEEGGVITVTAVTLGAIATKIGAAVKGLSGASDELLATVASHLNEYLNDECVLPVKFAQFHGSFVKDFLNNPIELEDEDGNPVENYDSEGEPIEVTYAQHLLTLVPAVVKVARAPKKAKVDIARFEAMQAKLLEMGITV